MPDIDDPRIEQWMDAAERGDVGVIAELLESGIDVDVGNEIGTTALMKAVVHGHVPLIKFLLARGASLTPVNGCGDTALSLALVRSRRWDAVWRVTEPDRIPLDLLVAAGAELGLREAVMLNDVDLARIRLDEGADPNTGEGTHDGPLLMIAAKLGHLDVVELLLDRGANLEATDDLGRRALQGAAFHGRTEVAGLLLDRGAAINACDWSWQTALSEAAAHGHEATVALLLSRGAMRQLTDAAALDDAALVEQLLAEITKPYFGYDMQMDWATRYAARRGNVEILRHLLDHFEGLSRDWPSLGRSAGKTLLMEAATDGHLDVVRFLIERGADVHETGWDGTTALDLATAGGHEDVAAWLEQVMAASPRDAPPWTDLGEAIPLWEEPPDGPDEEVS